MTTRASRQGRLSGSEMLSYDSERFGKIPEPETFDEILRLALEPERKEPFNVWMWRGQADATWRLDSAAYRRLAISAEKPTEKNLIYYEKRLIIEARYKGFDLKNGIPMSDLDVLARLQHHGAATRLIDATRNVLVGLYFSSDQNLEKTGVLFGFHAYNLGGYEGASEVRTYADAVAKLDKFSHPQTWQPSDVSPRIAAQHSQFLYSSIRDTPQGSLAIDPDPMSYLAIAISPKMKNKVTKILSETFDIGLPTLFPDLEGFCQSNSVRFRQNHFARW